MPIRDARRSWRGRRSWPPARSMDDVPGTEARDQSPSSRATPVPARPGCSKSCWSAPGLTEPRSPQSARWRQTRPSPSRHLLASLEAAARHAGPLLGHTAESRRPGGPDSRMGRSLLAIRGRWAHHRSSLHRRSLVAISQEQPVCSRLMTFSVPTGNRFSPWARPSVTVAPRPFSWCSLLPCRKRGRRWMTIRVRIPRDVPGMVVLGGTVAGRGHS